MGPQCLKGRFSVCSPRPSCPCCLQLQHTRPHPYQGCSSLPAWGTPVCSSFPTPLPSDSCLSFRRPLPANSPLTRTPPAVGLSGPRLSPGRAPPAQHSGSLTQVSIPTLCAVLYLHRPSTVRGALPVSDEEMRREE